MEAMNVCKEDNGLRVVAYPGDNKILLAMSIDEQRIGPSNNLAGFAIWRKYDGKAEEVLGNRIAFDYGVSKETTAKDRKWTDSDKAPFQKFRWVDVPPEGFDIPIMYRVKAMYFTGQGPGDQGRAGSHDRGRAGQAAAQKIPPGIHPRLHRLAGLCRQVRQQGHPTQGTQNTRFRYPAVRSTVRMAWRRCPRASLRFPRRLREGQAGTGRCIRL
jgi:hypothetical protein